MEQPCFKQHEEWRQPDLLLVLPTQPPDSKYVDCGDNPMPEEMQSGRERNWVYRRRGRPCYRCGTPIEMIRQDRHERMTYFCSNCQK